MAWLLGFLALMGLLAALRWAVHRSLAPERVSETSAPDATGLPYQDVSIATEHGKTLFGWFIPVQQASRSPAVVLLHGWGGNAETLLPLAQPLHDAGFATLLIDARCHGKSDEDTFASMAWLSWSAPPPSARVAV
jgi:uncharacterized protein